MKGIIKITKIVTYVSQCAQAIAKGLEAASAAWPTDNPFNNSNTQSNEGEPQGLK